MSTSEYVDMLLKGRKQMISYLEYLETISIFDLAKELEDIILESILTILI